VQCRARDDRRVVAVLDHLAGLVQQELGSLALQVHDQRTQRAASAGHLDQRFEHRTL
jgi:hypothetical protein